MIIFTPNTVIKSAELNSNFAEIVSNSNSNPYKFSVYRNAAANTGNNTYAVIAFDTKEFDTGNNVSTLTGIFTTPIAGFYHFEARFGATTTRAIIALFKNGVEFKRGNDSLTASAEIGVNVSAIMQLALNDTVEVRALGATAVPIAIAADRNYFQGYLISRT